MFSTRWNPASRSAVDVDVRAEVAGAVLDGLRETRTRLRRRLDQQQLESLLIRKQLEKIGLRHHQLALKDAVAERRDEAQPHGPPAPIDDDVVAEVLVQDVGHRVRVRDDRDDEALIARRLPIEEQPRISALGVAARHRALKGEAAGLDEARGRRPGSSGSSARTGSDSSHRRQAGRGTARAARRQTRVESQRLAAVPAVGIVGERQQQIDQQRIAAHARAPIACGRADASKRVDRDQDEGRRRDHGDGEHAAAGPIGGMAQAQPAHRPPAEFPWSGRRTAAAT